MASFDSDDNQTTKPEDQKGARQTTEENNDNSFLEYNGKQMSREDVLKKLNNADQHIGTLEGERSTERDRIDKLLEAFESEKKKTAKMQELLERMGQRTESRSDDNKDQKTIDPDQLVARAENAAFERLTKERQDEQKKANQKRVAGVLRERYGDKVDEEVFQVTRNLGYSDDEAYELAGTKPDAFLRMVGVEQKSKETPSSTRSSTQTPREVKPDTNASKATVLTARTTNERVNLWNQQVEDKLRELGLQVN